MREERGNYGNRKGRLLCAQGREDVRGWYLEGLVGGLLEKSKKGSGGFC